MTSLRIPVGSGALLKSTWEDDEGVVSDLDNPPTVEVRDAAGTLVDSGIGVDSGVGVYTFPLDPQTELGVLTATWEGELASVAVVQETQAEVVGATYFTLAELRAQDAIGASFTGDQLRAVQAAVEDRFEEATGVAWVRRGRRQILNGDGSDRLVLDHWPVRELVSLSVDGTDSLATAVSWEDGWLYLPGGFPTGERNVVVTYVHGYDAPPADLKAKALLYARYLLLGGNSRIPDRATLMSNDFGTFNLATAGKDKPTGLPEVDAVLNDYDRRLPGMA